ncbi:MAG TPA: sugar ABC transporter permease [Nocardioidaceae bacterium]|nr:sugar ABC transporter permease [Nocardioidaceae bacterium]
MALKVQTRAAWLFMGPSVIILAAFVVYPMTQAAYLSLTDYDVLTPARFIGLDNYRELVGDPAFRRALLNTLYYAAVTTPVSVALALGCAILLNRRFPLRGLGRTAVFLPVVVGLAVVAIAWSFLLDPDIGLLSYWLGKVGLTSEQGWLRDPDLAMPAVMLVGIWKNIGFYMVIYLAGLQSIPGELYEAAKLDGARGWGRFRTVTWPLLANQTLLVLILCATATLQAFDQIYVMTRGGPFFRTETLVMLIYRQGFSEFRFGYAAAISWVLVALILVLSLVQLLWFRRRRVEL